MCNDTPIIVIDPTFAHYRPAKGIRSPCGCRVVACRPPPRWVRNFVPQSNLASPNTTDRAKVTCEACREALVAGDCTGPYRK